MKNKTENKNSESNSTHWENIQKESELDGGKRWIDKKIISRPKPKLGLEGWSRIIGNIVTPLALLISFYSVYSTSTHKRIRSELKAQFSKNLIDEQWTIHKTTKDKIASILSSKSPEEMTQLLKELNTKIAADVYSTNDIKIIKRFDEIRVWLEVFDLVNMIYQRSIDMKLYVAPVIVFEEGSINQRVSKVKNDSSYVNYYNTIILALEKLKSTKKTISELDSELYSNIIITTDRLTKSLKIKDTSREIDDVWKLRGYAGKIATYIFKLNHSLVERFIVSRNKIIETSFE